MGFDVFPEKNEPPPYNWDTGKKAHDRISIIVDLGYNGKPIGDPTDRVWDLKFDRPIKRLRLGSSLNRPDIISKCYPKLIWEIKPVTHLEQKKYYARDDRQLSRYLNKITDKTYTTGEAVTFFPANIYLGRIYDKKGDEYNLKVISNHRRKGFIYYKLERTGNNKKEELEKEIKEALKKLLKEGPIKPQDLWKYLPGPGGPIPVY